jgi:shikimate kinase
MPKHVTLTGMMGSGKSTVAPSLASVLGRKYLEIDKLIEKREKMPISQIFRVHGEAHFRELERLTILEQVGLPAAVLSLGGGAFLWPETRKILLEQTAVFFLSAQLPTLLTRLSRGIEQRPLLSGPGVNVKETLSKMLEQRLPVYRQAHVTVETDALLPKQITQEILRHRHLFD